MTLVSWFDEVAKGDNATVGGKGANLGEFARGGLPVPPSYVVTAEAYFRSMEVGGVREELRAAFAEALRHAGDPAALSAATARLQELVRAAGVAKDVRDSVLEAYRRLGDDVPVAVRSSATAEDGEGTSFAGSLAGPSGGSGVGHGAGSGLHRAPRRQQPLDPRGQQAIPRVPHPGQGQQA